MTQKIWVPDGNAQPDDYAIAHLRTRTVPYNLIWSELAQQLWSHSIQRV